MSLEQRLQTDLITAMKAKDSFTIRVIKEIKSKILVKQKDGSGKQVGDVEVVQLIKKSIKEHEDTASYLADKTEELQFINKLRTYLPLEKSPAEVWVIIRDYIAENGISGIKEMGNVMKYISANYPDIDKSMASTTIKAILS